MRKYGLSVLVPGCSCARDYLGVRLVSAFAYLTVG